MDTFLQALGGVFLVLAILSPWLTIGAIAYAVTRKPRDTWVDSQYLPAKNDPALQESERLLWESERKLTGMQEERIRADVHQATKDAVTPSWRDEYFSQPWLVELFGGTPRSNPVRLPSHFEP